MAFAPSRHGRPDAELDTALAEFPAGTQTYDYGDQTWQRVERLLAFIGVALIGMRINLPLLLTLGDVLAFLAIPLWFRVVWRSRAARALLVVGFRTVLPGSL